MGLSVRVMSGTGFEVLVRAVAVADPHWRSVLTDGDEAHREARRTGGTLARDAARFGRFGWINLLGPLAETPGSRHDLLELVQRLEPAALRRILVGGRRTQLQRLVPASILDGALQGDLSDARELRRALPVRPYDARGGPLAAADPGPGGAGRLSPRAHGVA